MKKKYVVIFSVLIILSVIIYICIPKAKEELSDDVADSPKVNTSGFLTLMLEQDDGTYEKSSSSTWPASGYIYNDILSKCENGGELVYDRETNIVKLISSGSDKCYVYFDKYTNPVVNSITVTGTTASSISISVSASGGTNSVTTYYYSINNGSYTSSSSNIKTFTGLSKETTYTIKVYVTDTNGVSSSVETTNAETSNPTFADTCRENGTNTLACYVAKLYTSQGSNGLYYHDANLENGAADNSYRYAGADPNNYVCFGSTASTCPEDNLYRIIGVFDDEVKLIKATKYGRYVWASIESNTWSISSIRTTLNTTFYNTLNSTWQTKIATHTWKVGGLTSTQRNSQASIAYESEVGNNSSSTTDNMKIGLMYVSDYGFAASNNYWTTSLGKYSSATSSNWLYSGISEWTISRESTYSDGAFGVANNGIVVLALSATYDDYVRPSFYLTSSTTYVSGSGTSSDPIRIT